MKDTLTFEKLHVLFDITCETNEKPLDLTVTSKGYTVSNGTTTVTFKKAAPVFTKSKGEYFLKFISTTPLNVAIQKKPQKENKEKDKVAIPGLKSSPLFKHY